MKKIMVILIALVLALPVVSFAGAMPLATKLSNGVSGSYFVNATTDATEYSLSTGHAQGNRVYFSGSNDARIYYNDLTTTFASSDLLSAHVTSFESNASSYDGAL